MVIKSCPLPMKDTETCVGSSLASYFVLFSLISFCFHWFRFISFSFRCFRFVSFRFCWFCFVSFRFVFVDFVSFRFFLFRFALYRGPTGIPGENHWPVGIHWQTLPQNIASSTHYKGQAIKDKGQTMIYKRLTQKLQNGATQTPETNGI